jgi:Na+/H+ antiporter NhaA
MTLPWAITGVAVLLTLALMYLTKIDIPRHWYYLVLAAYIAWASYWGSAVHLTTYNWGLIGPAIPILVGVHEFLRQRRLLTLSK